MEFSVSLAFCDPAHYVPIARAAEEAGFGSVVMSDHVIHPKEPKTLYPYTEDGSYRWEPFTPWVDPWVAVGSMASVTQQLRFYTSIYVLPMRNPFQIAKTVGSAAVLSNNRVTLGVGMGWCEEEFDLLEQPFRQRGKRADEMLDVLATLWGGGWVEHHGEFYDFDPLEMSPVPSQSIPVWVGGISDPAMRRAARHQGWIGDMHTVAELREIVVKLDGYREQAGNTDGPFDVVTACTDAFDLDGYRQAEDAGVTVLMTLPWVFYGGLTEDLDVKLEGIAKFGEDIIAKLD